MQKNVFTTNLLGKENTLLRRDVTRCMWRERMLATVCAMGWSRGAILRESLVQGNTTGKEELSIRQALPEQGRPHTLCTVTARCVGPVPSLFEERHVCVIAYTPQKLSSSVENTDLKLLNGKARLNGIHSVGWSPWSV